MKQFALALLFVAFSSHAFAEPDPVEGKWWGTTGSPRDTVDVGFEIHTDEKGALVGSAYAPVLNLFGIPVGVKHEGDTYTIPEFATTLKVNGDSLEGTLGGSKWPVKLHRIASMPAEAPVPDLPKGPSPLWQTRLGGSIYAAVATRDGIAYVGSTAGVMNAVNVKDGKFAWTFSAGHPIHGEALVTADAVYFVSDGGGLYKLNRADGKQLWRYDLGDASVERVGPHPAAPDGWDYQSSKPVIADDVIYVGSGDGSMHAVKAATGDRVWRFATKGKIRDDALVTVNRVFFGSHDGGVYAVNRANGALLWRQETHGPVTSTPALIDGKVVVGNRGPGVFALNPENGEIVWRAPMWGSWVESTAVQSGDVFYIGASDLRRVTCYDPKDGRVVWRTDVYGWNWGRPLVTDKLIYIGAAGGAPYMIRHVGSLTALDRATGKIAWRWPYPADNAHQWGFPAGPVLEGKTLVVAAIDGMLFAFPAS